MSWTPLDLSYKTLLNKRETSSNKQYYNEIGDNTINTNMDEVWTEAISTSPAQAISQGVAEQKTLFILTEDITVSSQQCYYASDTTRLKDWISDKYGTSYLVQLYQNNDTQIFPTDPSTWSFNYQTGILTFNGSTVSFAKPFKISAYRYIGRKGSPYIGTADSVAVFTDTTTVGVVASPSNLYLKRASDIDGGYPTDAPALQTSGDMYFFADTTEILQFGVDGVITASPFVGMGGIYSGTEIDAVTGYKIDSSAPVGHYLRGDGSHYTDSTLQSSDLPGFLVSPTYVAVVSPDGTAYINSHITDTTSLIDATSIQIQLRTSSNNNFGKITLNSGDISLLLAEGDNTSTVHLEAGSGGGTVRVAGRESISFKTADQTVEMSGNNITLTNYYNSTKSITLDGADAMTLRSSSSTVALNSTLIDATSRQITLRASDEFGFGVQTIDMSDQVLLLSASGDSSEGAFKYCTSIDRVIIGNTATVGSEAFSDCTSLASAVFMGNAPGTVGSTPFDNAAPGFKIYYQAGTTGWTNPWHGYSTEVVSATDFTCVLGGSDATVTGYTGYIGPGKNIIVPSMIDGYPVVAIGDGAFQFLLDLAGVIIPDGVTQIGVGAFYECRDLVNISIPNSVTNIDATAFRRCSFNNVTIPANVANIGDQAFYDVGLVSAIFMGNAPSLGINVFDFEAGGFKIYYQAGTTGWTNPWNGYPTEEVSDYTYVLGGSDATITGYSGAGGDITIPSTVDGYPVVAVGRDSFTYNTSIIKVTIPSGITQINGTIRPSLNLTGGNINLTATDSTMTMSSMFYDLSVPESTMTMSSMFYDLNVTNDTTSVLTINADAANRTLTLSAIGSSNSIVMVASGSNSYVIIDSSDIIIPTDGKLKVASAIDEIYRTELGSNYLYGYRAPATGAGLTIGIQPSSGTGFTSTGGYIDFATFPSGGSFASRMLIDKTGGVTISALAGAGTRTVVVDANGKLSAP